ncbi:N(2)-citryl-N(6)-acetyl-N(6)-hydroxylysine synthase [Marinomonas aquimarina]|uniref:N(2)-citryl-N(6)-acetyl-N(6)-hydroxylysine synthase n=1 Tax=Marinomonas aquimarina TaxID=295068 RepID=A0A1A8TFT4_9GAMM|nr:IucA/IucC family protein [Marinomonas aquimarina]SBS30784.1 N(2)-citryl-N(6)-acetyl-N(6)-hydroxylysine synthase [Marinomonas aquimarina]
MNAIPLHTALNQERVQQQAITCLLNCYLREYALPHQHVEWPAQDHSLPLALRHHPTPCLLIRFPHSEGVLADGKLAIQVRYFSALGKAQFVGRPWLNVMGRGWTTIDAEQTLQWLLAFLSQQLSISFNHELMAQLRNSLNVTEYFIAAEHKAETDRASRNAFIDSEQSLLWGHAFHPTPKSRTGISLEELYACSPEVGSEVRLYWFYIDKALLKIQGPKDSDPAPLRALEYLQPRPHDTNQPASDDYILYPCHPWEVQSVLNNPLVEKAIEQGLIKPHGQGGVALHPTSSVRTLYHPELEWFPKFSINVRLTNCIRKNAWYELESAVQLTQLLKPIREKEQLANPLFQIMIEPYATTVDLSAIAATELDAAVLAQESFGILYRENFSLPETDYLRPTLAAALFAHDRSGNSLIAKHISDTASQRNTSYQSTAKLWFAQYIKCLLPGVFNYFFKHGVAFEPHLQNTLIGFDEGFPCSVYIRDLEGTKLLPEHWSLASLSSLSERAQQSVYYAREQGWNRIAYCSFINNISEAIFHIANGSLTLELSLWRIVRTQIEDWQAINGAQPELVTLLAGGHIPSKNNFTTRLMQQSDKESGYTHIPSPWH